MVALTLNPAGHLYDFHPYVFESFLIVLTVYFLLKRKFIKYFFCLSVLLLIREYTSIYAILFGIYALFFLKEKRIGLLTVFVGTLYFFITIQVLIPYFRGAEGPYHTLSQRYSSLGSDFSTVIKTIVTKPQVPLSLLTDPWSLRGWGYLLIPVAFLPLLSLRGIIMIIPTTSLILLSDHMAMKTLGLHIPVSVVPFYLIGAILSLEYLLFKDHRLFPFIEKIKEKVGVKRILTAIASFILTSALFFNYYFDPLQGKYPFKVEYYIGTHHLSPSPTGKYFNSDFYRMNEHDKAGKVFINEIKKIIKESPLSVELRFASHFSDRFLIRSLDSEYLPYSGWGDTEYVFFDIYGEPVEELNRFKMYVIKILEEKEFGVIADRNGYVLLKRGADTDKNDFLIKEIRGRLEAEDMFLKTGTNIFDLDAINKKARFGKAGIDRPDFLIFGRYMNLPKGSYRVTFRIKAEDCIHGDPVATVEVVAEKGKMVLSKKELKCVDFLDGKDYKDIGLSFSIPVETEVEPRVFFTSKNDLWVDKITLIPD